MSNKEHEDSSIKKSELERKEVTIMCELFAFHIDISLCLSSFRKENQ